GGWTPAVDIVSNDDTVDLNVELPGMKKEDITVNIEDRVLTIAGERKVENEEKKENYYRRERRYGSFKRAFTLSDDILTDEITAEYTDGILKVSLRKDTVTEKVKQITVN
ncbi:MAG: Hsp20/alpha crystallin family protein, partial [Desulfobacterales bacterium]|nr:Hsp20/alpha crystallin family protein [Desulfobacterales bacterium]